MCPVFRTFVIHTHPSYCGGISPLHSSSLSLIASISLYFAKFDAWNLAESSKAHRAQLLSAFHNVLSHICLWTVVVTVNSGVHMLLFGHQEMSYRTLWMQSYIAMILATIQQKWGAAGLLPKKERQKVEYDREHASKCVRSDWYSMPPRFNDWHIEWAQV